MIKVIYLSSDKYIREEMIEKKIGRPKKDVEEIDAILFTAKQRAQWRKASATYYKKNRKKILYKAKVKKLQTIKTCMDCVYREEDEIEDSYISWCTHVGIIYSLDKAHYCEHYEEEKE